MKIGIFLVILSFLLSGCLGLPLILGSSGITNLVEKGVVECSVNVGIERLWRASIIEFRKIEIIEADKKKFYIKAKYRDIIIEFKAGFLDDIHSIFKIKAFDLRGFPQNEVAEKFAGRIYKRARSLWFSLNQFSEED